LNGKFDERIFYFCLDRKKDYLRRRGENISVFEIGIDFASDGSSKWAVAAVHLGQGEGRRQGHSLLMTVPT